MRPKPILLPSLPAVPTTPMPVGERQALAGALSSLKKDLHDPAAQACALDGYARVWLHLLLSRGLDPRNAMSPKGRSYATILPAFLDAVARIGLHDKPSATWWAPKVALQAGRLWHQAIQAQGGTPQPLPGLGLESTEAVGARLHPTQTGATHA